MTGKEGQPHRGQRGNDPPEASASLVPLQFPPGMPKRLEKNEDFSTSPGGKATSPWLSRSVADDAGSHAHRG
jgi:hypothetical protein